MSDHKKLIDLSMKSTRDIMEIAGNDSEPSATALLALTVMSSALLSYAAAHGSVIQEPNLKFMDKVKYMGDKTIEGAMEGIPSEIIEFVGMLEEKKSEMEKH